MRTPDPDQCRVALVGANAKRVARGDLGRDLQAGTITIAAVLRDPPACLHGMTVAEVLYMAPFWGRRKVAKLNKRAMVTRKNLLVEIEEAPRSLRLWVVAMLAPLDERERKAISHKGRAGFEKVERARLRLVEQAETQAETRAPAWPAPSEQMGRPLDPTPFREWLRSRFATPADACRAAKTDVRNIWKGTTSYVWEAIVDRALVNIDNGTRLDDLYPYEEQVAA